MYNGSFFNPYMTNSFQAASNLGRTGIGLKGLFKGFNFSNFLTSTGKTLNVINQAIPIFYQVKPIFNNAKTMLRVMGAVRDTNSRVSATSNSNLNRNIASQNINSSNSYISNNASLNDITNSSSTNISNNPAFFL